MLLGPCVVGMLPVHRVCICSEENVWGHRGSSSHMWRLGVCVFNGRAVGVSLLNIFHPSRITFLHMRNMQTLVVHLKHTVEDTIEIYSTNLLSSARLSSIYKNTYVCSLFAMRGYIFSRSVFFSALFAMQSSIGWWFTVVASLVSYI